MKINFEKGSNDKDKAEDMIQKIDLRKDEIVGSYEFKGIYTPNLSKDQEGKLLYDVVKNERTSSLPSVEEIELETKKRNKERKKKGRTPYVAKLDLSPQTQSRSGVPYTWAYFGHMDITSRQYHYAFLWAYYHPDIKGEAKVNYKNGSISIKVEK